MGNYGPQFRPKKRPRPETTQRWARERVELDQVHARELRNYRELERIGVGYQAAGNVSVRLKLILDELRLPCARYETPLGSVEWYARPEDVRLVGALVAMYPNSAAIKFGKKLRRVMPTIKAVMGLGEGEIDEAVQLLIREAMRR